MLEEIKDTVIKNEQGFQPFIIKAEWLNRPTFFLFALMSSPPNIYAIIYKIKL